MSATILMLRLGSNYMEESLSWLYNTAITYERRRPRHGYSGCIQAPVLDSKKHIEVLRIDLSFLDETIQRSTSSS
jgi:hypothetical protein